MDQENERDLIHIAFTKHKNKIRHFKELNETIKKVIKKI